jgi:redox-sensitive bicupin YhaK (pirin superfamily)
MKKQINLSTQGQRADIGALTIYRIIPNRYLRAVGPFVFLDHIAPVVHALDEPIKKEGTGAHPHRGIATLTYVLNGEDEHFDSAGNYAKVNSGGIQWMKAGNGIIHDENLNVDPNSDNRLTHAFQFWVNLPAVNKAEPPAYLAIQAGDVPRKELEGASGWIKVIAGDYENLNSIIPNYSKQFIYHIHLNAGKKFSISSKEDMEIAGFLPESNAFINEVEYKAGDFIDFDRTEGTVEIKNNNAFSIDFILFGGEHYAEPIVAEGPFVMNSKLEIADAYRDFFNGKYGEIKTKNDTIN